MFEPFELIHSYSRAQAIQDGALVDVTAHASEAGFCLAVAVTARVWSECVAWPETEPAIQDESGRLWDLVYMAAAAARTAARRGSGDRAPFEVLVVPRGGQVPRLTRLVLHVGPGDRGEAVVTIMTPGED